MDVERRDWIANSGWPFSYDELAGYYPLANRFMKVDELDYEEDIFRLLKMKRPGFDKGLLRHHFSKWAPEPNFRKIYGKQLLKDVTMVYNAVLTKIELGGKGRVVSVTVKNFEGAAYSIPIRQLVLAAGCIETNRILLSNDEQIKGGVGNHSGWLGKYFMDHPCIEAGTINTDRPWQLQAHFNTHIKGKRRYSVRLSAAGSFQKRQKLVNGSASVLFAYESGEMDPYLEIRRLMGRKGLSSIKSISPGHIGSYILSAAAYASKGFVYKHKAAAKLIMMLEQEPVKELYTSLSGITDRFDTRQAAINWHITPKTWETVIRLSSVISGEMKRLSLGEVNLHPYITAHEQSWATYLSDVNHHMGGVRMSDAAENGVVNKDLMVWGYDNLYVCSTAVFPTGSHSNPTLTMLALAQRLADKIITEK